MDLKVDPARVNHLGESQISTGIYVRATLNSKRGYYDIASLDRDSLHAWLRSRGEENLWAENGVLSLLGHRMMNGDETIPLKP